MLFEEIRFEAHGSPVQHAGAVIYRPKYMPEPAPELCVYIWGAHDDTHGGWESRTGFVLPSREQLKSLIDELQGIYYGWPGEHR